VGKESRAEGGNGIVFGDRPSFPDWDILFQAIHKEGDHGEGFGAVNGGGGDEDGGLADGDDADAMGDADVEAGMELGDVEDDLADEVLGHGLVGFVDEGGDGLVIFGVADETCEVGVSSGEAVEVRGPRMMFEGLRGDGDFDMHGVNHLRRAG
jgi:hypothetical protein